MVMSCTLLMTTVSTILLVGQITPVYNFTPRDEEMVMEKPKLPFACDTYIQMDDHDVHCYGKQLNEVPNNLSTSLNKLIITDSDMKYMKRDSFEPYRDNLQDVTLSNLPYLRVIEEGAFADIPKLRTIYISYAPQLKFLHSLFKGVTSTNLKTIRIVNTGLIEVPDFRQLPPANSMFLLDLDHNKIQRLPTDSIKVTAQQVTINFNDLTTIDDFAFRGSQIARLDIRSNEKLKTLGENAFSGIQNLRELDLFKTSIEDLPFEGLKELETLKIERTPSLHTIPSIYDLANLKTAKLTHHFHCCAFKYPEQHNPEKHAKYEQTMLEFCKQTSQQGINNQQMRRKRDTFQRKSYYLSSKNSPNELPGNLSRPLLSSELQKQLTELPFRSVQKLKPLIGKPVEKQTDDDSWNDSSSEEDNVEDDGVFHAGPMDVNSAAVNAFCGSIFKKPDVDCTPEPNALNPCEDIMGFSWLRISVWFVVILAVVGNMFVIIVILFSKTEINVSRFLICNLAIADLCMGLYLLLIASMDYHSVGAYFNFAFDWQYGIGCQIAGFLTVFSAHLSIFTLTVITIERWFAITFAIHLTRRIRLGAALKIMAGGWIYSIALASLPLFGISNYGSTSICLPMEVNTLADKAYLYGIILINGLAFTVIVWCYTQIYFSLGYETRRANTKGEMTIAKKMALLIFTDFFTYSPIAFFSLCALAGYPLIGVTKSKILLVFFYPLNACANPYLYALMTGQYRRDLYIILSRCGICKQKAETYRLNENIPMTRSSKLLNNSCSHHHDFTHERRNNGNGDVTLV